MAINVEEIIKRDQFLDTEKNLWTDHWQLVGEFINTRKADFNISQQPGSFLNDELWDSTAPKAARRSAASLIDILWPKGGKNIKFEPVHPKISGDNRDDDIEEYFEWAAGEVLRAINDPKANFDTAIEEYMSDNLIFGTSALAELKGTVSKIAFHAWSVRDISISDNSEGVTDTIYRKYKATVRALRQKYGEKKLSEPVREHIKNNKLDEEIEMLHVIEPRVDRNIKLKNNLNMPWVSLHIERKTKNIVQESGFEEMPAQVGRLFKKINEKYGRGAGMEALPDVIQLNTVREAKVIATEKLLDPPLAVYDDGKLGNSKVDTSAKAINVFRINGRLGSQVPVQQLVTVGDIRMTLEEIDELKQSISEHFFVDLLLDFNVDKEMTLGETQIRNSLRQASLGTLLSRQISEVFTPMVERVFNMMFRNGDLGFIEGSAEAVAAEAEGREIKFIPEALASLMGSNDEVFEIQYLTPAARLARAAEAQGIVQTWQFAGQQAATHPEVVDKLDEDRSLEIMGDIAGAPPDVFRDDDVVKDIRKKRQEDLKRQQELAAAAGAA